MQTHSNDSEAVLDVKVSPLTGVYWGPLVPLKREMTHKSLLSAIAGRSNIELLTATAFNRASDTPCGCFDIAVDAISGDGCGIYRMVVIETGRNEPHDAATPAFWYQYEKAEDIVVKIHKHLDGLKFFENLYNYVEKAVRKYEEKVGRQVH